MPQNGRHTRKLVLWKIEFGPRRILVQGAFWFASLDPYSRKPQTPDSTAQFIIRKPVARTVSNVLAQCSKTRRFLVPDAFWSKMLFGPNAFWSKTLLGTGPPDTGPKLDCYGTANIARNANLVRNASLARNRYFGPKPFSGPKPLSGPKPPFGKKPLLGIN